jgi:hypothetical protein
MGWACYIGELQQNARASMTKVRDSLCEDLRTVEYISHIKEICILSSTVILLHVIDIYTWYSVAMY